MGVGPSALTGAAPAAPPAAPAAAPAPAPAAPKPVASRRNVENMAATPMMGGRRRKNRINKNRNLTRRRR